MGRVDCIYKKIITLGYRLTVNIVEFLKIIKLFDLKLHMNDHLMVF